MSSRTCQVPAELEGLLLDFTVDVLLNQPCDLVQHAVDYFTQLRDAGCERGGQRATRLTGSAAADSLSDAEHDSVLSEDEAPPVNCNYRRKSVFAEAYNPEEDEGETHKLVYPKSDEQRARLGDAVRNILLFRSLDPSQMHEVLDAMFERKVSAGEKVIVQDDDGDNFYVVQSGKYSTYVLIEGQQKKVGSYDQAGSFGELALMYNMPRAATIEADTDGSLWAMDRQTFRRIVLKSAFKKRKMYEELIETVPMLGQLERYERMNVCDALVPKTFEDGSLIIKQGDEADGMYFVEDGQVVIKRAEHNQPEQEVSVVSKGGYIGELALITKKPRAASAYAVGAVRLAFLDREAFERLLGNCMDIMKRKVDNYEEQLQKIFGPGVNISDMR